MSKRYFVTGIGTGVGKTIASALLCEYLKADYFKPIQTGYPPDRDSHWVKKMVNYAITIHPEIYLLKEPASPHLSAFYESINISINDIVLPSTSNTLIIEGAGGLLVPLNETHYIVDLFKHLNANCILVISDYLGCINHSLLSLYYIQKENIPLKGIILNGNFNKKNEEAIIKNLHPSQIITRIPYIKNLDKSSFQTLYEHFKNNLNTNL